MMVSLFDVGQVSNLPESGKLETCPTSKRFIMEACMTQRATKYQVRIIAGSLRGRKLNLTENPALRPMADRVRAALFSILGNAVPGRPFFDIFAGSGAVGLEAYSREASHVTFVERDRFAVQMLEQHLTQFGLPSSSRPPLNSSSGEKKSRITVLQADAYRWGDKG